MAVEVHTQTFIGRPRQQVAAFACSPDNAPLWYTNIKSVEWVTERPLALGSQVAFVAHFLGRRLAYTYQIVGWEPGFEMVMRTAEGPFPMETSYRFEDAEGGTTMSLRNRGDPAGFSRVTTPLMVPMMRRANRKDLSLLKQVLEAG